MKKGIIFDMDGTLWDASGNVAKSWDEVIQKEQGELRKITAEDFQNVMGLTMTKMAEKLFPMLALEEAVELMDKCCARENDYLSCHGGMLYPDLEETLKTLCDKYPLYIVSNCQKGYVETFLKYYHFEQYFQDIECFGNNNLEKGDNIALVVKRNRLDAAVYVGDIQGDYDSSCKAGVKFIHAMYGFGTIQQEVPAIKKLSELPVLVEKVLNEINKPI